MKIATVVGARPQFIKAGSVSREINNLKESGENIEEILIHTGQHFDENMSKVFFDEMQIPLPKYNLQCGDKSHGEMTGKMIQRIEEVLLHEKPDILLVYGDTNSTLAGSIAASKLNIKIAHIEAGLRSFNMQMPEEINRILTDRISSFLFCPSQAAVTNLKNEGISYWQTNAQLIFSGDVMLDGALFYKKLSKKPKNLTPSKEFILCTIHRAENTNNSSKLIQILEALIEISKSRDIILPLHPRTKKILSDLNLDISNISIIEPVGYLNMIWLIDNCSMVMTDSGGLQKEAFFFKKPCITLRDQTEWVELVENNVNILTGANKEKIISAVTDTESFNYKSFDTSLYGDGNASRKILAELV